MKSWKSWRISLLAAIFGSVLFVLGRSILADPNTSIYTNAPSVFPPEVPLSGWEPLANRPLSSHVKQPKSLFGRQYQYIRNGFRLELEMRYIVDTDGDIMFFLQNLTSIPPNAALMSNTYHQEGVGFYSLFTYQGKAYLNTCINPRGGTTVTAQQFMNNRNTHDVKLERFLPWLLGKEHLRDPRCLWLNMSAPVKGASSQQAYEILKTTLFSAYPWWQQRFPKP
ncbi:MAG TPA: cyanoexosortase A system-associated protein [Coleofasciculaceae cyanobacterium]|jgi:cyanosortase A-associated protein